jgi:TolB-like protein/class 3 adenylate cyclase/Flp pilus assembly protein TadD
MVPRVERRLAAILAADVVGYSRLMQADEAGTHARLKALRKELIEPRIAEHAGRIVKLTGDGALVEFASVVEAVLAAAEIQRAVIEHQESVSEAERIAFRIGINLGDVIFDEADIYGDGVNVAARLEGLAEPGGICVARTVYNHVRSKVDLRFEPGGAHQVKNIAEPVEVYRVRWDGQAVAATKSPSKPSHRWAWSTGAAAAAALLLAGASAWWWNGGAPAEPIAPSGGVAEANPALPLPDQPSIAVLPFENLSDDPKRERLAGGLTEDVITDLARFHDLFVIARNSTEVYRGKAVDIREVAHALGVQFVLEGSLQIEGNRVRITAQLIDGTTGSHVWAERYDRPLGDMFAVQEEVTQRIAGTLAPSMGGVLTRTGREHSRRKPPQNLQAYDYYLLGIEHKHRYTPEDNQKAQELLTTAIGLDPGFARAYVGMAMAKFIAIDNGWTTSREKSMEEALNALRTALALDPSDGQAQAMLGSYYSYFGDAEHGLAALDKALSLSPNDADILAITSALMPWFGRPEQAAELAQRAVRLNPGYPDWYNWGLLLAYFYSGQYDRALAATQGRLDPDIYDYVYRPLIYAQLRRPADARTAASDLAQRDPDYSAERFLSDTGSFARDTELSLFVDSNRKAGLPVCAAQGTLGKYPDMKRLEACEQQRAKS